VIRGIRAAVLADDVRFEDNGKAILIGVYNAEVIVGSRPAIIPLNIFAMLDVTGEAGTVSVRTEGGGFSSMREIPLNPGPTNANIIIQAQVIVTEPRDRHVWIKGQGETDWRPLASWRFDFAPDAAERSAGEAEMIHKFAREAKASPSELN